MTASGAPDDIYHLVGLWDLILCYDELLEQLGLEGAAFVGHSFGAMVACEVAAAYPRRASRLALIDPLGLWRDDAPVVNWMMLNPQELPGAIFRDPASAGARVMFAQAEDEEARVTAQVGLTWAMGATAQRASGGALDLRVQADHQAVASAPGGAWGGQCLSMGDYVTGTRATRGAPAAGGR